MSCMDNELSFFLLRIAQLFDEATSFALLQPRSLSCYSIHGGLIDIRCLDDLRYRH